MGDMLKRAYGEPPINFFDTAGEPYEGDYYDEFDFPSAAERRGIKAITAELTKEDIKTLRRIKDNLDKGRTFYNDYISPTALSFLRNKGYTVWLIASDVDFYLYDVYY